MNARPSSPTRSPILVFVAVTTKELPFGRGKEDASCEFWGKMPERPPKCTFRTKIKTSRPSSPDIESSEGGKNLVKRKTSTADKDQPGKAITQREVSGTDSKEVQPGDIERKTNTAASPFFPVFAAATAVVVLLYFKLTSAYPPLSGDWAA